MRVVGGPAPFSRILKGSNTHIHSGKIQSPCPGGLADIAREK